MIPLWDKIVDIGNKAFPEWYRQTVQEAVAEAGGDPELVEVQEVVRPPLSSPLIAQFFVELAAGIALRILDNVESIKDRLTTTLDEAGIPSDSLFLMFSPTGLEELACGYVRRQGHPRAGFTITREPFNTVFSGGYPRRIDETKPAGWEITVSTSRVTYSFVVDAFASVFEATRQEGQERVSLDLDTLLDDLAEKS